MITQHSKTHGHVIKQLDHLLLIAFKIVCNCYMVTKLVLIAKNLLNLIRKVQNTLLGTTFMEMLTFNYKSLAFCIFCRSIKPKITK